MAVTYNDYLKIRDPWNFTNLPPSGSVSNSIAAKNGVYNITYSFLQQATVSEFSYVINDLTYQGYYIGTEAEQFFTPSGSALSVSQKNAILTALKSSDASFTPPVNNYSVYFGDVANLTFGVSNSGAIAIGSNLPTLQSGGQTITNTMFTATETKARTFNFGEVNQQGEVIGTIPNNGDIWFNSTSFSGWSNVTRGNEAFFTVLHELGHALGLQHPQPKQSEVDSLKYTMMSTFADPDMGLDVWPTGLQLYDVAALQSIYGRNYLKHGQADTTFGAGNGFAPGVAFVYTIWDGGGDHDKINATGFDAGVQIDLRQGQFSSIGLSGRPDNSLVPTDTFGSSGQLINDRGNVAIAFFSVIEDAIGAAGGDVIVGNAWNNTLDGAVGNDVLFGDGLIYNGDKGFTDPDIVNGVERQETQAGMDTSFFSGNDLLIGGAGNDVLMAGAGSNQIAVGGNPIYDGNNNVTRSSNEGIVEFLATANDGDIVY